MLRVGKVDIFVLLEFEDKLDREISLLNLNSKHHDKYKFALKLIILWPIYNLFPLEVYKDDNFVYCGETRLISSKYFLCMPKNWS